MLESQLRHDCHQEWHLPPHQWLSGAVGRRKLVDCLRYLTALVILITVLSAVAAPPKRLALVVGNASYDKQPLKNPVNDASDLSKALRQVGFQVLERSNRSPQEMRADLAEFRDLLRANPGAIALFYFSGHGVQVGKGMNYLLPVGATYRTESDAEINGVDANSVLRRMQEGVPSLSILVLDACRDAPLQAASRSSGSRGLARMEAISGSLIAFATSAGSTADDNANGRNGLYTKHLLAALGTPGLRLEDVFKRVRRGVERESQGQQSPEETSKLISEEPFYFKPGVSPAPGASTQVASIDPLPVPAERPRPAANTGIGKAFSDCDVCPQMTLVSQGKLSVNLSVDKGGPREVGLSSTLAVGINEVTFREWDACVADGGCPAGISDEGWGREKQPVINVSWTDAKAYTQWLSARTGQRYRLLREAEWEYVARAGAGSAFPWGADAGLGQANCFQCGATGYSGKQPAPVGSFTRNAFGLYDVVGNVWEWTEDCHTAAVKSVAEASNLSESCTSHVLRGGSFKTAEQDASLDRRRGAQQSVRSSQNGFRVARED